MGVQIQRSRAYPESSYIRFAFASDPLSDPPTVHMHSSSGTNWASSQKALSILEASHKDDGQGVLGSREDAECPGDRSVNERKTGDPEHADQPGKQR